MCYGRNLSPAASKRCLDAAQVILHRQDPSPAAPSWAVMTENKAGIREDTFRVFLREPEDGRESGAVTLSLYFLMTRQSGGLRRKANSPGEARLHLAISLGGQAARPLCSLLLV